MATAVAERARGRRKKKRISRPLLVALLLLGALSAILSVTFMGYEASNLYHQSQTQAESGIRHLRNAEVLLESLPKHAFATHTIQQAQQEFSGARVSFTQLDDTLGSLPGFLSGFPPTADRLSAASHLVPFALSVSQMGIAGCQFLTSLTADLSRLSAPGGPGLGMNDVTRLDQEFQQTSKDLNAVVQQAGRLQPSDLQLNPRLSKMFATFQKEVPAIQQWLGLGSRLFAIAPTLLGIPTTTHYLIEILDSTELRPGGGFIGSYGIVTVSGGKLVSSPITDSNLLDRPFEATGQTIPYPPTYGWFDLAPTTWSFRDSNLDANFVTAARYGEQTYTREGGKISFQGVIAITPEFIQQLLALTGPIAVPEYHETVTAQNLIARIHYHQLDPKAYEGSSYVPSPDGNSSLRKHFTAVLADHFFARLREVLPTAIPRFFQLAQNALRSKDMQVYFNSSAAEGMLQSYGLDGSLRSSTGDGLFVVDANISPSKANGFIVDTASDQVTIDAAGNALHRLTLRYAWTLPGPVYGSPVYRDYLRVYAQLGSVLRGQNGWQPRSTAQAFGHAVWAGFFTLTYGQTHTITLEWTVPHAASKDSQGWSYDYLLQKQAGSQWKFSLRVALPACATVSNRRGGLVSISGQAVSFSHSLNEDTALGVRYRC